MLNKGPSLELNLGLCAPSGLTSPLALLLEKSLENGEAKLREWCTKGVQHMVEGERSCMCGREEEVAGIVSERLHFCSPHLENCRVILSLIAKLGNGVLKSNFNLLNDLIQQQAISSES